VIVFIALYDLIKHNFCIIGEGTGLKDPNINVQILGVLFDIYHFLEKKIAITINIYLLIFI